MGKLITSQSEIPKADYYVTCTDNFLSGWGLSEGKKNRLILPCTRDQVDYVENYAKSRSEMKYVNFCTKKPRLDTSRNTYSLMSPDNAKAWYPEVKS